MSLGTLIKSLKPHRREHWMMLAVFLYSCNGVLKYYLPNALSNAIMMFAAVTFILVMVTNIKGMNLAGATGTFYAFLILWSLWLTFHMFFIADVRKTFVEYHGLTTYLLAYFGGSMFLPNLMPFVILTFPRGYRFDFCYLWQIMLLMGILYCCYYPFAFWNMTHFSWTFDVVAGEEWGSKGTYGDFISNSTIGISSITPAVIMVYFKKYIKPKQWNMFFVAYVGSLLLNAYMARRGGLVLGLLYLSLAWITYSLSDRSTSKLKMLIMALLVVALCVALFTHFSDSFFSTLVERGDEDSRSGVEDDFYADMNKASDWWFGRGWFGTYYEPAYKSYRMGVETGYLTLILRGGLLYLVPYILILGMSFFNGYFRSNNLFCKSFAIMCLMQIVSLYPFGLPAFNFFHFIIWIGVWICNSKSFRSSSNKIIMKKVF